MRIFILYQGPFGEQIINHISTHGLAGHISGVAELRPDIIEEEHPDEPDLWTRLWETPEHYLPRSIGYPESDLLLVLGLHSRLSDLVPPIARKLGVKGVIYGIDDRDTQPEAKKNIREELESAGIAVMFPEPLCSMHETGNPLFDPFVRKFGRPCFAVEVDRQTGIVLRITVIRDTPCGTASCLAPKLEGVSIRDLRALAQQCYDEHHNESADNYCLAEMDPLHPLMQEASDMLKDAVFSACGLPCTRDLIVAEIKAQGEIRRELLEERIVHASGRWGEERIGCTTRRAFLSCLDELIAEGTILCVGADNLMSGRSESGNRPPSQGE